MRFLGFSSSQIITSWMIAQGFSCQLAIWTKGKGPGGRAQKRLRLYRGMILIPRKCIETVPWSVSVSPMLLPKQDEDLWISLMYNVCFTCGLEAKLTMRTTCRVKIPPAPSRNCFLSTTSPVITPRCGTRKQFTHIPHSLARKFKFRSEQQFGWTQV